jgi:hypothetical protein
MVIFLYFKEAVILFISDLLIKEIKAFFMEAAEAHYPPPKFSKAQKISDNQSSPVERSVNKI